MKTFREVAEGGLPLGVFPDQIKDFIEGFSKGSGTPSSFCAAGVLACSAGMIDNSTLEVKYGYIERPNLFLAVVGQPGVSKSPPLKAALAPLAKIDKKKHEDYKMKMAFYKSEANKLTAKEARKLEAPKREPSKIISDGTIEGLISHLAAYYEAGLCPHAVFMRDELKGHFGGMNQYKANGAGSEYETWLSLFSGENVSRVLKGETIFIPGAIASVIGGIQPEVYAEHMQDKGDGMVDRFIVAYHDKAPTKTNIFDFVDYDVIKGYNEFMLEMYEQGPVEYSFWDMEKGKRKDLLNCVQDFFDWTHMLGEEYEFGAFKKWEQQFCRLCIHLARMHNRKSMTIDIVEMAKDLMGFYATDWLKSRICGEDDTEAKIDGKALAILKKARGSGCTPSEIRQRVWDFRGKERKKVFDESMGRLRTKGLVRIGKNGRFIHPDFTEGV